MLKLLPAMSFHAGNCKVVTKEQVFETVVSATTRESSLKLSIWTNGTVSGLRFCSKTFWCHCCANQLHALWKWFVIFAIAFPDVEMFILKFPAMKILLKSAAVNGPKEQAPWKKGCFNRQRNHSENLTDIAQDYFAKTWHFPKVGFDQYRFQGTRMKIKRWKTDCKLQQNQVLQKR